MSDVTVYWRPLCGYCETLKDELERHGVGFTDVDIWNDRAKAEVVRAATGGDEVVPTVQVGEVFLVNPSTQAVLDALDAAASG